MKQFVIVNIKTVLWTIVVVGVCIVPGNEVPSVSIIDIPHLDKVVHATLYFILTVFSIQSFSNQKLIDMLNQFPFQLAFVYALILGVIVELVQYNFIPHRSGDVLDALANMVGSLLAIFIVKKGVLSFLLKT